MRSAIARILASIVALLGVFPAAADPAWPTFVVVSQTAGVLTGHASDGTLTGRVQLDRAPAAVVVSADGETAFVSQPESGSISLVRLADFTRAGIWRVGGQPFGLAQLPGGNLLVADWSGDRLAEVDAEGRTVREVAVGDAPSAVVLSADGRRAYTLDRESDGLSVVDLASFTVEETIDVGRAPFAAALSKDGRRLFVANVQSNDLSVVDLVFRQEIARIPVGGMPYGVAVGDGGRTVAVTDQSGGRLVLVEARSLTLKGIATVGDYAEGVVALDAEGAFVVANWFSDTVSIVSTDGRSVSHVPVASGPRMLAVVPRSRE